MEEAEVEVVVVGALLVCRRGCAALYASAVVAMSLCHLNCPLRVSCLCLVYRVALRSTDNCFLLSSVVSDAMQNCTSLATVETRIGRHDKFSTLLVYP